MSKPRESAIRTSRNNMCWRFRRRWWWAKLWRTRDYRYVVNDAKLPANFDRITLEEVSPGEYIARVHVKEI